MCATGGVSGTGEESDYKEVIRDQKIQKDLGFIFDKLQMSMTEIRNCALTSALPS